MKIELIGSAAVPIKGKNEIGIMIITNDIEKIQNKLSKLGFKKGPIEGKTAFLRDYRYGTEFHVVNKNSKKIERTRKIIKILQANTCLRKRFKDRYNRKDRDTYRKMKSKLIEKILKWNL